MPKSAYDLLYELSSKTQTASRAEATLAEARSDVERIRGKLRALLQAAAAEKALCCVHGGETVAFLDASGELCVLPSAWASDVMIESEQPA